MVKQLCKAAVALPATFLLTSCRQGVLDPHGPVGAAERLMLYDATAIMLAVVVPVILLTLVLPGGSAQVTAMPAIDPIGNTPPGSR
jgi:hypothetical protein